MDYDDLFRKRRKQREAALAFFCENAELDPMSLASAPDKLGLGLLHALKRGLSQPASALSLLSKLAISKGLEGEWLYDAAHVQLTRLMNDRSVDLFVRASAVRTLAMLQFSCSDDVRETDRIMALFEKLWTDPTSQLLTEALEAWTLLLGTLPPHIIATDVWAEQAPRLFAMLHSQTAVTGYAIAVAEALAVIYQARWQLGLEEAEVLIDEGAPSMPADARSAAREFVKARRAAEAAAGAAEEKSAADGADEDDAVTEASDLFAAYAIADGVEVGGEEFDDDDDGEFYDDIDTARTQMMYDRAAEAAGIEVPEDTYYDVDGYEAEAAAAEADLASVVTAVSEWENPAAAAVEDIDAAALISATKTWQSTVLKSGMRRRRRAGLSGGRSSKWLRALLSTVTSGAPSPVEKLSLGVIVHSFSEWDVLLRLRALRAVLGASLVTHLVYNQTLCDMLRVPVWASKASKGRRLSKMEKRMLRSTREADIALYRDRRQKWAARGADADVASAAAVKRESARDRFRREMLEEHAS